MSEDQFERYVPQHPLPNELKTMKRDDTVCKYCGVSYLIHNEIKALEDKLKATEKELAFYKGCEVREKKLQAELDQTNVLLEELKNTVTGKDNTITSLNAEVRDKDSHIGRLKTAHSDLEEIFTAHVKQSEIYRLKLKVLQENLPDLQNKISKQKGELLSLKEQIQKQDAEIKRFCETLQTAVKDIWSRKNEEIQQTKADLEKVGKEKDNLVQIREKQNEEIKSLQRELQKMSSVEEAASSLRSECHNLHNKVKELTDDLDKETSKNRNLTMEGKHYQDMLRTKAQELESFVLQFKNKEQMTEDRLNKLQQDLRQKESALEASGKECQALKQRFQEQQREEEEIKRKATLNRNQSEEYKVSLRDAQAEIQTLKNEREAMITSHQNRIEQLRESFKKKMAEMDDWPKKLEDAVKMEREKHNAELKQLENKLKENFVLELQIEKQKHQELLDKYKTDVKDDSAQLKSQLSSLQSQHRSEISDLHKQIAENKKWAREMEESLRQEIASLKNIIKDLENRLAKLDGTNDSMVASLKSQLHSVQSEFSELQQENKALKQQVDNMKEEIQFLQDTVRRECEERFELTEALSEAKEQLLALKKPAGGYTPRNTAPQQPSPLPSAPKVPPSRSEEMLIYKRRASRGSASVSRTHKSPSPTRLEQPSPSRDSIVSSSAVTMGYDGEKAKTVGKLRGNNMADSRKRIADAVGRR